MNKTNKKLLITLLLTSTIFSLSHAQQADIGSECTDLKTNLRLRSWDNTQGGTEVTKLQKYLFENKFLNISPTGFFGSKTKQAVSDYQRSVNLVGTGFVGPLTRAEIKKDTCNGNVSDNGPVNAGTVTGTNIPNTQATAIPVIPVTRPNLSTTFSPLSIPPSGFSYFTISAARATVCNISTTNLVTGQVSKGDAIEVIQPSIFISNQRTYSASDYPSGVKVVVVCSNTAGDTTVEKTLTIDKGPEPLPTLGFTVNGASVTNGQVITLANNTAATTWLSINAASCTLNGGPIANSGSRTFTGLTSSSITYTCVNGDGKSSSLSFSIIVP